MGDGDEKSALVDDVGTRVGIFLADEDDLTGDRIYDKWNNFYQTCALVSALFLTFMYGVDGASIDLDAAKVCDGFGTWVTSEQNFKLLSENGGCEGGCNNVWGTCAKSHHAAQWYRTLCYLSALCLGLACLSAVRIIIVLSGIPDEKVKQWTHSLGFSAHIPGGLTFLATLIFLVSGFLQASVLSPPHHFRNLVLFIIPCFAVFGYTWRDTHVANSVVAAMPVPEPDASDSEM